MQMYKKTFKEEEPTAFTIHPSMPFMSQGQKVNLHLAQKILSSRLNFYYRTFYDPILHLLVTFYFIYTDAYVNMHYKMLPKSGIWVIKKFDSKNFSTVLLIKYLGKFSYV